MIPVSHLTNTNYEHTQWFGHIWSAPWLWAILIAGIAAAAMVLLWRLHRSKRDPAQSLSSNWHKSIPRYRRSLSRLNAEVDRARRYHHTLVVAVLFIDHEHHKKKQRNAHTLSVDVEFVAQFFFPLICALLRENLRGSDIVTYDVTNDHFVLLLPESGASAAEQLLSRLKHLVKNRTGVILRHGIAEYPADGLILADLVSRALARNQRTASETPPQLDAAQSSQGAQRTEPLAQSTT